MDPELLKKRRLPRKKKSVLFEVVKINSEALRQLQKLERDGILRRVRRTV